MTRAIGAAWRPERWDSLTRAIALSFGAVLSLLFHGSVLSAFLHLVEKKPGAIEQPTEAISLASVQSEILEAVSASQVAAAVSSPSVDATVGEIEESAAAQIAETKEAGSESQQDIVPTETEVDKITSGAEGIDAVRGAFESERSTGVEMTATELDSEAGGPARPISEQKISLKPKKHPSSRANGERSSEPKQKGAASVRAKRGSQSSSGRISASSGSALNYAALVRARVASRKPAGGGARGTVVVAFSVARSGALNSARIARSSGSSSLDGSVLAAVRSAGPFPPPPAGANFNFAMPFYFK